MEITNKVLGFLGIFIMLPIWGIAFALIVMGIIGLAKKNFVNFKKVLKVWGYFWLAFVVLLIAKFVVTFISNS